MSEFTRYTSARSPDNPKAVLFPTKSYALVKLPATIPAITRVRGAQGNVPHGGSTRDTTLTLSGTAEPGATVEIRDGSKLKGTAPVDLSGKWSLTVTGLTIATHSFKAIGLYGNSPVSGVWTVHVLKLPLTIAHFFDYWAKIYGQGSTATNNSPVPPNGTGGYDYLVVYPQGTGARGPNTVRVWRQITHADGHMETTPTYVIPRVTFPPGAFQHSGTVGMVGFTMHKSLPRQTVVMWAEDIETGETSDRFSFTFSPTRTLQSAEGSNQVVAEFNIGPETTDEEP